MGQAALEQEKAPLRCTAWIWSHSMSDIFLKLWDVGSYSCARICRRLISYPLSLKIPALLIRIVIPPKASKADLMTAGPSVTDEVFATAFPPAINSSRGVASVCRPLTVSSLRRSKPRTLCNLVHHLLCRGGIEIIHDDVRSP
jgi:hypothetical protein